MPYTRPPSFSLCLFAIAACASLTACGDEKGTGADAGADAKVDAHVEDAGSGDSDDVDAEDAGGETDAGVVVPEWLFDSCTSDGDCGSSGTCSLDFAGGLCTYACVSDAACGSLGVCVGGTCHPACGAPGLSCDNFPLTATRCRPYTQSRGYCTPACDPSPASEAPTCVAGRTCDPYSDAWRNGACVETPATEGSENGAACTSSWNCRSGRCFPAQYESGTPTGWPGGACFSYGVQPSDAEYEAARGGPMPTGSCPSGSAPYPNSGPGNETNCYASCASGDDCRTGYTCNFLPFQGMQAYTTGVCFPMGH